MKNTMKSQTVIKIGTRMSKLALLQTNFAVEKFKNLFPFFEFITIPMLTPGDKDKITSLQESSEDFFTRDIDNAVINDEIDCAFHSAKDLPEKPDKQIDYFYLPWTEDRRDVLVYNKAIDKNASIKIGVSSQRRANFCRKNYPHAELLSIRGNIEERLQQLDGKKYNMIITAAAALHRLGLSERISEYIELSDLDTPEAQGTLAVTYKKGNKLFNEIRKLFVHPVVFAGAGIGSLGNITNNVKENLESCDICLYDALCPENIETLFNGKAQYISVGKRKSGHSFKQNEITEKIINFQRQGKRVLRLKGGDIALFARLAEEINTLTESDLPYRTYPGISSLFAAFLASGCLPTRRNGSRGFTVYSAHKADKSEPELPDEDEIKNFTQVIFMGISAIGQIVDYYISKIKISGSTPVSVVFNAGMSDEQVINSHLSEVEKSISGIKKPGIIFIGKCAEEECQFLYNDIFREEKVLFAGSKKLSEKAIRLLSRYGKNVVAAPLIDSVLSDNAEKIIDKLQEYNWIILSSPTAAEIFMKLCIKESFDLRNLPGIIAGGSETAKELNKYGLFPEIFPNKNYGSLGIVDSVFKKISIKEKILRLTSNKSSKLIFEELNKKSYQIDELVLYNTKCIKVEKLPDFTSVLFTSPSSIDSFTQRFGEEKLRDKTLCVIGKYTKQRTQQLGIEFNIICPEKSTLEDLVFELAVYVLRKRIKERI